jgi:hypothetical protein
MPSEPDKAQRCNQCGQEFIEIDNRGKRLIGCLTCNLWAAGKSARWIRLNEEDLRALYLLRYSGSQ